MIYSKLLGQYARHLRKQILEKAIELGEKSKKNQFLTKIGWRIQIDFKVISLYKWGGFIFFLKKAKICKFDGNVSRFIIF